MSTALAALAPAELQSSARYGSGTAVQTLAGSVSAFFTLEGFDRRLGVATYALRVVNRTASALVCRTWIISCAGDAVLANPLFVEVAPQATACAHVSVWPRDFASFDRAIAEIAGEGVHCIVEAPPPVRIRARRQYLVAGAVVLAGLVLLGTAAALRGEMPRIPAFAVPPEAIAGTTIHAEYDASGMGRLSYTVFAPDGRTLQSTAMTAASGSIPFTIPVSSEPGAYTLQMVMTGPLGSTTATRVLNTMPVRGRGSAQIASISVKPPVAQPGQTVEVAYAADGDAGYVRLVGADGTIWEQRPFSRDGATQLTIPHAPSLREMRVVLHVDKGHTTAQSMAGLVVASAAAPAFAAPQIVGDNDPTAPAASSSDANETFEVLESTVKSGGSIHVRILSPRNGMRIALTDGQSHEVSGIDVGAETDALTLRAPVVWAATRYTVVASFTDGFGQESVVAPVTVEP
ncbi:MAG: hypothetical protein WB609_04975 [Candidatus Cybelea sp.]